MASQGFCFVRATTGGMKKKLPEKRSTVFVFFIEVPKMDAR